MNVSNSTGQSTGYRVVGAGGALYCYDEGQLEPEAVKDCPFPSGSPFRVQFFNSEGDIACATFHKGPEVVSLREDEWGIWIQSEGRNGTASKPS